jgi:putative PIN family toxin of toxin-antitoxin system
MRMVADTNVIVSALVFGGLPRQVIDLAARGEVELYFSAPIQDEVERVLEQKFGWSRDEILSRARVPFSWGTRVDPRMSLIVVKDDPDDDRILECAMAAQAHAIISGDRHLLRLGVFRSIAILTPRQFLDDKPWKATKKDAT